MGVSVWVGGLFTRFKREEVATMKSGKRDKERGQIDDIVNVMTTLAPGATNEREGSEITPKIVSTISLRADGRRTFKLIEGGPWGTSFGEDLRRDILGRENARRAEALLPEQALEHS